MDFETARRESGHDGKPNGSSTDDRTQTSDGDGDQDGVDGSEARPTSAEIRALRTDRTLFQLRILGVLADEADYGLGIKETLEAGVYGDGVYHSRLYQNTDHLVEDGLVEKEPIDRRTNEYRITELGRRVLQAEVAWLAGDTGVTGSYLPESVEEA